MQLPLWGAKGGRNGWPYSQVDDHYGRQVGLPPKREVDALGA